MRRFARLTTLSCLLAVGSGTLLTACGSSNDNTAVAGPHIKSVELTASPDNVLAYTLAVTTDKATTLSVQVTPEDTSVAPWTVTDPSAPAVQNAVVIAGLRADSKYAMEITATDDGGRKAVDSTHSIATDPLPADLPPIAVTKNDPSRMAPGNTLFNVFAYGKNGLPDVGNGWLVMLDPDGKVVWYAHTQNRPEDARLMPGGTIGYSYTSKDNTGFIELDQLSQQKKQWVAAKLPGTKVPTGAIKVDVDTIHHEVFPMPNGNFLTLSTELRKIDPTTCQNYGGPLNVVGDDIVEFSPDTGKVVHSVSEFDFLDPCRRLDHGFETDFWGPLYGGITTQDWTHSNAVVYDAKRQMAVVSVRHQDWIVGLSWPPSGNAQNDVAWLLGDEGAPGDYGSYKHFTPTSTPFDWQYHQHGPMVMKNGDILLFDNGNLRPGTNFDPNDAQGNADLPYSRVVQFHIDTSSMTISKVWEYKAPDDNGGFLYCPFLGDADELDNGDVLATFGGAIDPPTDNLAQAGTRKFGRIVELVPNSNNDIVYQVSVRDPAATNFKNWSIYRAERVKGFLR